MTRGCDLTLFMGCRKSAPHTRTVLSNHSDYNAFANTSWAPTMRDSWNPDNTLAQWRARFKEDAHSALVAVDFRQRGTGFALQTWDGLPKPEPLPSDLRQLIQPPPHVGCRRTAWPARVSGGVDVQ